MFNEFHPCQTYPPAAQLKTKIILIRGGFRGVARAAAPLTPPLTISKGFDPTEPRTLRETKLRKKR